MHDEIKSLSTGPRELRKFGLLVGGVFLLLGTISFLRHKPIAPWLLAPGAFLFVLGLVLPRALKQIYVAWMTLALGLGFVVSSVLLTVFFYLVITPIGLIARGFGKGLFIIENEHWREQLLVASREACSNRC